MATPGRSDVNDLSGFWAALPRPIVGLSPMDGITDVAARAMACRHGDPSLTITEFVSVEGLTHGAVTLLTDLLYEPDHRPIVAQLYGVDPDAFRECATIATALGFDGIDINMGCPASTVANRGAGAALIKTPELARHLIRAARQGVVDWANGGDLHRLVRHAKVRREAVRRAQALGDRARRVIPVSVKTRVGFDTIEPERWMSELAEESPAAITLHGRTLKQLYSGRADWDAIGRARERLRGSDIVVLGNGDLADRSEAIERARAYGLDGALIGRATVGNPWALSGQSVTVVERLRGALEHADAFETLLPDKPFFAVRKHLHGYCRGFDGAPELRRQLMFATSAAHCRELIEPILVPLAA
ncbi:MAG: tRNA-dihydrouridine synthase [Chloroflexota bacterium]|nr:MAG: tRNA-dihydrouridine synthase [Chloroflexota bacterium]